MLTADAVEIHSKPLGFTVSESTIREVSKEFDDDSGWRFQAVLKNESRSTLTDIEIALRYYDSNGKFLGLDEGVLLGSEDLEQHDDKSVSISLDPPPSASKGKLILKARKTNLLEKHNFSFFALALIVVALLVFAANFFR